MENVGSLVSGNVSARGQGPSDWVGLQRFARQMAAKYENSLFHLAIHDDDRVAQDELVAQDEKTFQDWGSCHSWSTPLLPPWWQCSSWSH